VKLDVSTKVLWLSFRDGAVGDDEDDVALSKQLEKDKYCNGKDRKG